MLPPLVPMSQRDGEKLDTNSKTSWSWQIIRTGVQVGICRGVRLGESSAGSYWDPAVCESDLKSSLLAVLPPYPLLSQVQDGLSPCRTALTPCYGVEKDEQPFLLYKDVLLLVYFVVHRSQGHRTRCWGTRNIISLPDWRRACVSQSLSSFVHTISYKILLLPVSSIVCSLRPCSKLVFVSNQEAGYLL